MDDELASYRLATTALGVVERAEKSGMKSGEIARQLRVDRQAVVLWRNGKVRTLREATARAVRRLDRRLKSAENGRARR